jgi:hypothetical protein
LIEFHSRPLNQPLRAYLIIFPTELFSYPHPFIFSDLLKRKLTKHEFEVQFKIIQVFTSVDIEKTFDIRDFFQNYPSTLTNQQKTKIKKYFI